MKKIISILLIFSNAALADCDFSKGITKLPDGNYEYSTECHLKVGQLVQDNKVKAQQIDDLTQAVQLKDLALQTSDSRVVLWQKSSQDEMDRLNKLSAESKRSDWMFFALGAVTVIGAGFMAARLVGR